MNFQILENAPQGDENTQQVASYEAPAIESVLTPELLEREVHYAGNIAVISGVKAP